MSVSRDPLSGGDGTGDDGDRRTAGIIECIFSCPVGSAGMVRLSEVEAVVGMGLAGDRYARRTGHWTGKDECQVTLVEGEALDAIARDTALSVHEGQHRRNLVTRGVRLDGLEGRRFWVGAALLAYERPRPPCRHVEQLSEPGLRKALTGRGGICARVLEGGLLKTGDPLMVAAPADGSP